MRLFLLFSLIFLQIGSSVYGKVYHLKIHQNPKDKFSCTILVDETVRKFRGFRSHDKNELHITINSAVQASPDSMLEINDKSKIIEIFARKKSVAKAHMHTLCKSVKKLRPLDLEQKGGARAPEIVKIINGGDPANRIDVVFMGDGYQLSERQEFFDDISRLTKEMFEGVTFRSYLPVFNIWAVFVESVDSGIGYNGPQNTPFKLYREAGQLRGIYPGNASYARQICTLTGPGGCDYPSIIGNDDFYGGLGGEFVISTRSNRTGTVVLRHEMGHNFVDVGEEYDNGQVYDGVNSASSLVSLGWRSWLSGGTEPKEERATYRILEYPWADLSKGQINVTFESDGKYNRWYMEVSVSAAGEEDSLEFTLDGQVLPWKTHGFDDREFYGWYGDEGFTEGSHSFSVRSKTPPTNTDIPRMICSIRLHEFGDENEFHMNNDYVSAYPTFDTSLRKTYRPTNAGCLMRNMTHNEFCPVCREGMWYQFLQRISLIDSVDIAQNANPDGTKTVTLHTLKLGQLRAPGNEVDDESLEIKWIKGGVEDETLRDLFEVDVASGAWMVEVKFVTLEVRSDPQGLLSECKAFTV